MKKICLIGNGNLAHAIAACSHSERYSITIYSANAGSFEELIEITNIAQPNSPAKRVRLTNNLRAAVEGAAIVLLCVPTHVRRLMLEKLNPYMKDGMAVGAFPGTSGFDGEVKAIIQASVNIFSAQRVPYICRIIENNKSVEAFAKPEIYLAASNFGQIAPDLNAILGMPCVELAHFDEVNLSNSNPLLHTARLHTYILRNGEPDLTVDSNLGFYADWNNVASEVLLAMDEEFMKLACSLGLKGIKSLKEHYKVNTSEGLTLKIRSIEAFKKIKFPHINKKNNITRIDLNSRYFKEDYELGLKYILFRLEKNNLESKTINLIYKEYDSSIKNINTIE